MTNTALSPEADELASTEYDSPIGPLTIVASRHGIRAILWVGDASDVESTAGDGAGPEHGRPLLDDAVHQLSEYFDGVRKDFDLPLDPVGTEFQRSAWDALRTIPFGETVSYGEQARRMGDRRKARAVGAANGQNPIPIVVPCHRVVGSDGSLTGFAGGLDTKRWLLRHEEHVSGRTLRLDD